MSSAPRDRDPLDPAQGLSFGQSANEYARMRFRVPSVAFDWLLTGSEARVLDLAAGTGQVSEDMTARGLEVVAVEPDERMLAELRRRQPTVQALGGRAESIPLSDASVDAVVVSGAWHWFDEDAAAAEVARVLRVGGRLGVVATTIDADIGWVRRLYHPDALRYREQAFGRHAEISLPEERFTRVQAAQFSSSRTMGREDVLAWFRTYSVYQTADPAMRAEWEEQINMVLAELFSDVEDVEIPSICRAWRAERASSDRSAPR